VLLLVELVAEDVVSNHFNDQFCVVFAPLLVFALCFIQLSKDHFEAKRAQVREYTAEMLI
jgi:hypothetical protein